MEKFHFGLNLRIIRQAKGISQDAMAIGLGISQTTYSKLERNPDVPDTEMLAKIVKVVDEDETVLLSGRKLADLVPKMSFEQKAKSILDTPVGIVFYWILIIPFVSAAYDMGNGFCRGYGTSDDVREKVRFLTGLAALIFVIYWFNRIRKGKY